jgi:hypothetical protein
MRSNIRVSSKLRLMSSKHNNCVLFIFVRCCAPVPLYLLCIENIINIKFSLKNISVVLNIRRHNNMNLKNEVCFSMITRTIQLSVHLPASYLYTSVTRTCTRSTVAMYSIQYDTIFSRKFIYFCIFV